MRGELGDLMERLWEDSGIGLASLWKALGKPKGSGCLKSMTSKIDENPPNLKIAEYRILDRSAKTKADS